MVASEIQRHADEFPLGLHPVQAAQAELSEPQDVLDPAVGWLGEPLASAVGIACGLRLHPLHHRRGQRQRCLVDFSVALTFASNGHHQVRSASERLEHPLASIACVGQGLFGIGAERALDCLHHRGQFVHIRGVVDQLGRHDDVSLVIDGRLPVVGRVEPASGALHDAAVGVGEVVLILVLRHAERSLVAPALGLTVLAAWLLVIVVAAPACEVRLALTLLQPGARCGNRVEPVLPARDLGRDVQLGFVLLGLVGGTRPVEQGLDLGLQLGLGLEHVAVAHRLVATRVGLDLGAVHSDGAQLDQAHLARQAHDLHEQVREFLQVQCAEVTDRAVGGEVARGQNTECHVFVQLARDLARAEHAGGVAIDQHLDHHGRVERLVARAVLVIARVERAKIQSVDGVANEVGQVPFGQPIL
jgi:hypothetical protein